MTRILAYAYDADIHCPHCTIEAFKKGALKRDADHPYAEPQFTSELGLPGDLVDREWNIIHPLFSTSVEQTEYCGDCHKVINGTEYAGRETGDGERIVGIPLSDVKDAIRQKYVWPGGYPIYLVCRDGEPLSIDAARENFREIADSYINDNIYSDWRIFAVAVNYEGDLCCSHSGEPIERAYPADKEECDNDD